VKQPSCSFVCFHTIDTAAVVAAGAGLDLTFATRHANSRGGAGASGEYGCASAGTVRGMTSGMYMGCEQYSVVNIRWRAMVGCEYTMGSRWVRTWSTCRVGRVPCTALGRRTRPPINRRRPQSAYRCLYCTAVDPFYLVHKRGCTDPKHAGTHSAAPGARKGSTPSKKGIRHQGVFSRGGLLIAGDHLSVSVHMRRTACGIRRTA
jgi:hypothetical protein